MRTTANILSVVSDAKINYGYRIQLYEQDKQRGIQSEDWSLFFAADNIIAAIESDLLSLSQQNLCCDWLIKNNFVLRQNNNTFSEIGFTVEDFDTI